MSCAINLFHHQLLEACAEGEGHVAPTDRRRSICTRGHGAGARVAPAACTPAPVVGRRRRTPAPPYLRLTLSSSLVLVLLLADESVAQSFHLVTETRCQALDDGPGGAPQDHILTAVLDHERGNVLVVRAAERVVAVPHGWLACCAAIGPGRPAWARPAQTEVRSKLKSTAAEPRGPGPVARRPPAMTSNKH